MVLGVIAVALPMRTVWPAMQPSPKKSPGPSMATTASRPVFDSTESFTPPAWMYITCSERSPCVKISSPRLNGTIVFATPGDSRNACTLKVRGGAARLSASMGHHGTQGFRLMFRTAQGLPIHSDFSFLEADAPREARETCAVGVRSGRAAY